MRVCFIFELLRLSHPWGNHKPDLHGVLQSLIILINMVLSLQNYLILAQNVLILYLWSLYQTAGMPRVGALPSWEIIHLMIMKLVLIDLITVIIGIVQLSNQEVFIPTITHDEVTLCGKLIPVFISVSMGRRLKRGQGMVMPGEPTWRSTGKAGSSNELNAVPGFLQAWPRQGVVSN